jgi:hypothetical protein
MKTNNFTKEEIQAAIEKRKEVALSGNPKAMAIYMAGEICMWNEMQSYADQCVKAREEEIREWIGKNSNFNKPAFSSPRFSVDSNELQEFLSTPVQVELTIPKEINQKMKEGYTAMLDEIINKHMKKVSQPPFTSSVYYFADSGIVSGSFLTTLRNMLQEFGEITEKSMK